MFVQDGDSIPAGNGVTNAQRFPDVAVATRTSTIDYYNVAVSGATCPQRDAVTGGPGGADALLSSHQKSNPTISISCGINDFITGSTEAQTLSHLLTYVSNRKAAGWTNIIVLTMTDNTAVSETNRSNYNADLRSNAVANGYTVADPGADANVGCSGCSASSTYFQSDHVHPTATGHGVMATYLETAMTAVGIN